MARRRFRRKDIKRPDEFVTQGRAFLRWALENGRVLSYSAGGAVALALVIAGVFAVRGARVRQANEDLSRALADFRAGRYDQAAIQLAEVSNRWQATVAGRIAGLYAASADLKANNLDAATSLLQEPHGAHDWPPYLRQQAAIALGFAAERKGDAASAATRYAEAGSIEGPFTAVAIIGEARNREQAGEKNKARELYERFIREFPEAPEVEVTAEKVELLQGVS